MKRLLFSFLSLLFAALMAWDVRHEHYGWAALEAVMSFAALGASFLLP